MAEVGAPGEVGAQTEGHRECPAAVSRGSTGSCSVLTEPLCELGLDVREEGRAHPVVRVVHGAPLSEALVRGIDLR
jgi:hypothetical protein